MKYLGLKLGALAVFQSSQSFLTGRYTVEMIEEFLEQFVAEFLLCSKCKIPEITFYKQVVHPTFVFHREPILRVCMACGMENSPISSDLKLHSVMSCCVDNQWMKVKLSPKARSVKCMFDNLSIAILQHESTCYDGDKCIHLLSDISICCD